MALTATCVRGGRYRAVEAGELSGLAWTKDNKYDRAENVLRLIHRSNDVTNWVCECRCGMPVPCVSLPPSHVWSSLRLRTCVPGNTVV